MVAPGAAKAAIKGSGKSGEGKDSGKSGEGKESGKSGEGRDSGKSGEGKGSGKSGYAKATSKGGPYASKGAEPGSLGASSSLKRSATEIEYWSAERATTRLMDIAWKGKTQKAKMELLPQVICSDHQRS